MATTFSVVATEEFRYDPTRAWRQGKGLILFLYCFLARVEVIAKALPSSACPRTRVKACWKGARGLGLVPCRAQRSLCRLCDGFAKADRCVLAIE
jgi:hypothetical protein